MERKTQQQIAAAFGGIKAQITAMKALEERVERIEAYVADLNNTDSEDDE